MILKKMMMMIGGKRNGGLSLEREKVVREMDWRDGDGDGGGGAVCF
jgi:hypothetical protein